MRELVVGIPTKGRPAVLQETLFELRRQSRKPDRIVVCASATADLEGHDKDGNVEYLLSPSGAATQRNAIINHVREAALIVFFDDDFFPDAEYLAETEAVFERNSRVVMTTGTVLKDGIKGPGLSPAQARTMLGAHRRVSFEIKPVFSGYGCNMAIRLAPVRAANLWFDERLPLYAWQEDVDFSCRLARHGHVVQLGAAVGVHLGVKSGRGSGLRLGYSQVSNPLYLSGKREGYPFRRALGHLAKNVAMNCARAAWAESYVDRRGRLLGNLLAFRDLAAGKMAPERVLEL